MDRLRVIHSTGQPNLRISLLYGILSPTGPSHPTSWVTSNGTGHTLRVELTRGLEHPTEWVTPWVRSVPMETLNTPKSVHVASHEELHDIDLATWSLMLPLWPLVPCNPIVPIPSRRPLVFSTLQIPQDTQPKGDISIHAQILILRDSWISPSAPPPNQGLSPDSWVPST